MDNNAIVFQGDNLKLTKAQYDTFVSSISTQKPTKEEIQLHLWYCDSKNVNPLDKLIYFTKRQNRYTPITSIDFMRVRAESSGLYAGSDDADFMYTKNSKGDSDIHSAKVTVYKMVGGQRCAFSATARWAEYAPFNINDNSAFMWKKMPHTMLAKCAEALALRKAFPGQLHGLYAGEEMAQDGRYINDVVEAAVVEAGNIGNENQDNKPSFPEVAPSKNALPVDEAFPVASATQELAEKVYTPDSLRKDGEVFRGVFERFNLSPKEMIVKIASTGLKEFTINQLIEKLQEK